MQDLLRDFEEERAALESLLESLPDDAWDRPSPAEGWTLRDCVSHLADLDDRAALICQGREPDRQAQHGVLTQAQVDARSFTPADMRRWYRESGLRLVDAMRGMDGSERLSWAGRPMGARSYLTARLMEHWSHGLDIFDAAAVPSSDSDRLKHIAQLGYMTREFSYRNRGLEPPASPLYLELTAPSGATWTWGPEDAPDRISGSAGDFCRVVTQRIHRSDTSLRVEGENAAEYLRIAQAFAGPPGPGRPPRST